MTREDSADSRPKSNRSITPPYLLTPNDFQTTRGIIWRHAAANLVIIPAYVTAFALVIHGLTSNSDIPLWLRTGLSLLIIILAALPVLLDMSSPHYWRTTNRPRAFSVLAALVSILCWYGTNTPVAPVLITTGAIVLMIGGFSVLAGYLKSRLINIFLVTFEIMGIVILIACLLQPSMRDGMLRFNPQVYEDGWLASSTSQWLLIVLAALPYGGIFTYWTFWFYKNGYLNSKTTRFITNWVEVVAIIIILFILLGLLTLLYFLNARTESPEFLAPILLGFIPLFALLSASFPRLFVSEQKASLRHVVRRWRQERLLAHSSPYVQVNSRFNSLRDLWIPRFFSIENRTLSIIICLLFGGVVVPVLLHVIANVLSPPNHTLFDTLGVDNFWYLSPLQLMLIGLVSAGLFLLVYGAWYLAKKRDKYVVTDFSIYASNSIDEALARRFASSARRMLIDELQSIGTLLRQRQIENVNFEREDANALFVTSGFEGEFFDQIQQIVTVEVGSASGTFDVGRLSALLVRMLARIRISGGVHRHESGTVELYVEMRYRSSVSPLFSVQFDAPIGQDLVEDQVLRAGVREIALKLLIAIGQVPGVGDSWKALDHFLHGLQATNRENWWQAIAAYSRALETGGETEQSKYGIVYYHLGSAYVYQGRWDQGRELLQKAERYGPALPETQYMLALAALYAYWGQLHKSPTVFGEIRARCLSALRMRPNFPEATQLLAMTYYRRARIVDRENGRTDDEKNTRQADEDNLKQQSKVQRAQSNYQQDYINAIRYYRTAIRSYDKMLRRSRSAERFMGLKPIDVAVVTNQRLTTAHRLGDALRGVGYYAEADQYYLDMFTLQPTNVRNIADMLKNYCLGRSWQRAEEFLFQVAERYEPARWDADVLIHAAWLMAGGAATLRDSLKRKQLALRAFQYADYAVYSRPRTGKEWRQTEWRTALRRLSNTHNHPQSAVSFPLVVRDLNTELIWKTLDWREALFTRIENERVNSSCSNSNAEEPAKQDKEPKLVEEDFCRLVGCTINFEIELNSEEKANEAQNFMSRIDLANRAYDLWKSESANWLSNEGNNGVHPAIVNINGKLRFEFYVMLSLFTARLLAESHRYEPLADMARTVSEQMSVFRTKWKDKYKDFSLSPRVFRYQYATIKAWYAYGLYHRDHDLISEKVSHVIRNKYPALRKTRARSIEEARKVINEAYSEVSVHPLVLMMRAKLLAHDGLFPQALLELKNLLDIIDPFDPKRDIGMMTGDNPAPNATSNDTRSTRYHIERVIGRQQFHNIVNPVSIYEHMADYAVSIDPRQSVGYLSDCVRRSPFVDRDFELFEKLGNEFINLERISDALAVAAAMKQPRSALLSGHSLGVREFAPELLEIDAYNRQRNFSRSRQLSRRLARKITLTLPVITDDKDDFSRLTRDFVKFYTKNYGEENAGAAQRSAAESFNSIMSPVISIESSGSFAASIQSILRQLSEKLELGMSQETGIQFSSVFSSIQKFEEEQVNALFEHSNHMEFSPPKDENATNTERNALYFALNHLAETTLYVQYSEKIKDLINKGLTEKGTADDFETARLMRAALYHGRLSRSTLMYLGTLLNAMAYSRTMLNLAAPNFAFADAAVAIYIFNFLYQTCDQRDPTREVLSRKLAQACDTYAWTLYNGSRPTLKALSLQSPSGSLERLKDVLSQAETVLRNGLRYDPSRANIHYHIAYLNLDAADLLLAVSADGIQKPNRIEHIFDVRNYLEMASTELENALNSDVSKRLRAKIHQLNRRHARLEEKLAALDT